MTRQTKIRWVAWSLLVCVLVAIASYGWWMKRGVEGAYAVWNVADFINLHMENHHGEWPRGWDDLEVAAREWAGRDVDISHWQDLVDVDFAVDPKQLAAVPYNPEQKDPPFRVVRHRRDPAMWYHEPNAMIWLYLNGQYPAPKRDGQFKLQPATTRVGSS